MFQSLRGLYYGYLRYRSDISWAFFIWISFSLLFAMAPVIFVWGPSYFSGNVVQLFSLAERGDLSLICIGIIASAVGKFSDSTKQRFNYRLSVAILGMLGILAHVSLFIIIRQSEGQLDAGIVEKFYEYAFLITLMSSIAIVLLAEFKPYHPRSK